MTPAAQPGSSPLLLGIYLGILLVVAASGAVVYAVQRDRAYLWYAVFQVGTAVHVFASDATGVAIFGAHGVGFAAVLHVVRPSSAGLMLLGSVAFAAAFLDTSRRSPIGHLILRALGAYAIVLIALTPLGLGVWAGRPIRYLGVVAPAAIFVLGWMALRRGLREAIFYLLGQGAFSLGVCAQAIVALRFTWVESSAAMALGSVADAGLLSLALVYRSIAMRRAHAALTTRLERSSRLATLGQLMAGIAHEINNPNGFVSFNLPLVERTLQAIEPALNTYAEEHPSFRVAGREVGDALEDTFRLIDHMKHGSRRITGLVDDLKAFSRGAPAGSPTTIDLAASVARAIVLTRAQAERRGVRVESDVSTALPRAVGWPERVEQVVVNLIVNAIQGADKPDPWVRVRAEASGAEARLHVEDNGRGIPAAQLGSIFDPFFTTRADDGGTGLGLTVCRELIHAMGGSIEVHSDEGRGARFTVLLPLASSADTSERAP